MNKEKAIATINEMPQNFELDVLLEKLVFIEKVEKGLEQLKANNTISHDEVKQRVKGWSK